MLAGAVQAAPASIPKPLVLSGPPSVPVEGGPEKLLTEYNYTATHFNCGRKTGFWLVLIPLALRSTILAIVIAILVAILLTLTFVLHLFELHIRVTLVVYRGTQAVDTSCIQHLSGVGKIPG